MAKQNFMGVEVNSEDDLIMAIECELEFLKENIKTFHSWPKKDYKALRSYVMCKLRIMCKGIHGIRHKLNKKEQEKKGTTIWLRKKQ